MFVYLRADVTESSFRPRLISPGCSKYATPMIELYQFPWSPFCLVQKRILEYGRIPHRVIDVPSTDRSKIWKLTRERYYQVPVLKDGRAVLFETDDDSQILAKYLDLKHRLELFPNQWAGVQRILWRSIEHEVESYTFQLNDIYFRDFVPAEEHGAYVRHKERKFGRGCIEAWAGNSRELQAGLAHSLLPFEQMVCDKPYLLDDRPRFVDFDLWGMLANFLFSGHYRFPSACPRLKRWHARMGSCTIPKPSREKLYSRHKRTPARSRRHSGIRQQ